MSLQEELARFANNQARLAAAKAAQKAALKALGRSPSNDWATYPDELRAVTGGSGAYQAEKTVTADPAGMTILPDEGYDGMLKAIIAAEPNFQPWNIVDGIEVWGLTGTAKVAVTPGGTDWPFPDADDDDPRKPPSEDAMDEAAQEADPDVNTEDKMVLVDNEGNITVGYLYNEPDSGLMVYNGRVLLDIDSVYTDEVKTEYPYAALVYLKVLDAIQLVLSQSAGIFDGDDNLLLYALDGEEYVNYKYIPYSGGTWGELKSTVGSPSPVMEWLPIWANYDILNADGTVYLAASEPTEYKGFEITWYDPVTTDFKAVGWRRVSKHTTGELAGQITKDNFTRVESGGWNYLKNIRSCTREKLYWQGYEIWPKGQHLWSYNGTELPPLPKWDREKYPYAYIANARDYAQYPAGFYGEYDLIVSSVALYAPPGGVTGGGVGTYMRFVCSPYIGEKAWTKTVSDEGYMYTDGPFDHVWSNHDIQKEDGTNCLSASDPIPV